MLPVGSYWNLELASSKLAGQIYFSIRNFMKNAHKKRKMSHKKGGATKTVAYDWLIYDFMKNAHKKGKMSYKKGGAT